MRFSGQDYQFLLHLVPTLSNSSLCDGFHNSRFLPLKSVVSLSLCCRPVYIALGTQYLEDLRSKEESTAFNHERFRANLERDLPDQIICHYCKKFHEIRKSHRRLHSNSDYFSNMKCWKMDYGQ
jgi:hypothetical protein